MNYLLSDQQHEQLGEWPIGRQMRSLSMRHWCIFLAGVLALGACGFLPNRDSNRLVQASTVINVPDHTPTATPATSPIMEPTMAQPEALSKSLELLQTNAGCQLPCWWGLTPGTSTATDARNMFAQLANASAYSDLPSSGIGHIGFRYEGDPTILIGIAYTLAPDHDLMQSINVHTMALRKIRDGSVEVYGDPAYNGVLDQYSLSQLLSTYRRPSQIVVSMEIVTAEPSSPDVFRIWLLYPERGTIARFTGVADVTGQDIKFCPSKTIVDLWLVEAGNPKAFQSVLSENTDTWDNLTPTSPYFKTVGEATAQTIDQFYEEFRSTTDQCLSTPLRIWPLH